MGKCKQINNSNLLYVSDIISLIIHREITRFCRCRVSYLKIAYISSKFLMILVLLPQKHLIGGSVSYVISEHIFFSRLLDLKLGRGLLLENSLADPGVLR